MFKAVLEKVVGDCDGGIGAILMGYDGIAIDQSGGEETALDFNLIGIEYSSVMKEIRTAADVLKIGELQEISIKTSEYYVIIRSLTDEYFVAMIIERRGNFGQGRYLLLRESSALREMLV
jgi:predicted regulator of Ras-like GTPase activity (Roadblock/LC7/MglB family)